MDAGGVFALAFFVGLVGFVCFEAVQLAKGRVHWRGIARAALEMLIVSPVVLLISIGVDRLAERVGLNSFEKGALFKWIAVPLLALIWAPWTHYRATQIAKRGKLGSAKGDFTVPDDFNDPLPKDIEDEFYK